MAPDETKDDGMPDFSGVSGGASTSATDAQGKPAEVEVNEIYEVVGGDSLSKIAKKKYGHADQWRRIYDANTDVIADPDVIQVGWKLKIPAKPAGE